jgi:dTDP-4-dehydrorhamnose 3,5-epimerase
LSIVGEGTVFDVAVDLRRSSPTFGRWVGVTLSARDRRQLWVPPGFAHGFYVLSEWAEIIYKVTDFYDPQSERTLIWNDAAVGIRWPLLDGRAPLLSPKDAQGIPLAKAELFA